MANSCRKEHSSSMGHGTKSKYRVAGRKNKGTEQCIVYSHWVRKWRKYMCTCLSIQRLIVSVTTVVTLTVGNRETLLCKPSLGGAITPWGTTGYWGLLTHFLASYWYVLPFTHVSFSPSTSKKFEYFIFPQLYRDIIDI